MVDLCGVDEGELKTSELLHKLINAYVTSASSLQKSVKKNLIIQRAENVLSEHIMTIKSINIHDKWNKLWCRKILWKEVHFLGAVLSQDYFWIVSDQFNLTIWGLWNGHASVKSPLSSTRKVGGPRFLGTLPRNLGTLVRLLGWVPRNLTPLKNSDNRSKAQFFKKIFFRTFF